MKAAVVGLRMGANHARALAQLDDVDLVALCDIDKQTAEKVAEETASIAADRRSSTGGNSVPVRIFTDFAEMLKTEKPDIVGIATPNRMHCEMTIQAVEAGVKGIYCEKPIAVDLGEARRMAKACEDAGVPLVINHQRRTGGDFIWIKQQLEQGAIGEPYVVRATCAGDMLSDGTHLIDSVLFMTGDKDWKWVFGAYHRDPGDDATTEKDGSTGGGYTKAGGWRFGHPVEEGMVTICELENGLRIEFLTGDLRTPDRPYHDIEIIGTKGTLWRSGDRSEHNVYRRAGDGGWETVAEVAKVDSRSLIRDAYKLMIGVIAEGKSAAEHPMGAPYALRGFELLMGAYESARTRSIVTRPVTQDKYPLAVELGIS